MVRYSHTGEKKWCDDVLQDCCRFGNFRVVKFSQISDFVTFHEV